MSEKTSSSNNFESRKSYQEAPMEAEKPKGLKVEHFFSVPGTHPFDQLEWENRSAKIASDTGEVIFEQDDIEVP
ncbi:MAG: hypothetical protein KAI59_00925, partial [Planctomycetes bacterium]|nr:hypothetical protein [Planctomycetota bacterium]